MSEQWFKDYALLALRIDRLMRKETELPYVDGYYGPSEWKAQVEGEPEMEAGDLVQAAMALAAVLTEQHLELQRSAFLAKNLVAMETVCRRLNGETFSLQDEVSRCFDVQPDWISETHFEEALDIYRTILPGKGTLARRLHEWRREQGLSVAENTELYAIVLQRILDEARHRTRQLVELPAGEQVELRMVKDKPFGAATFYQGNYRTLIEINTDMPPDIFTLVDDLCHEAYPGHHTEFVLKEEQLYRQRGYREQSIPIVLSPGCLISEGIATSAMEMIFAPGELEDWLAEDIYPLLGLQPAPVDLSALRHAGDVLEGVRCNAILMLREGRADEEVRDYLVTYMQPAGMVEMLMQPFHDIYMCTYYYGKQLLAPVLHASAAQRNAAFRRLLMEQLVPSDLR